MARAMVSELAPSSEHAQSAEPNQDTALLLEALEEQKVWRFGREAASGIRRHGTLTGNVLTANGRHYA